MRLSRSLYKGSEVDQSCENKVIVTDYHPPRESKISGIPSTSEMKRLEHDFFQQQAQQVERLAQEEDDRREQFTKELEQEKLSFLTELNTLKRRVLDQAQVDGEGLKQLAHEEGLRIGQEDGYQSGYESGYQAGIESVAQLKEQAISLFKAAEQSVFEYQKEKQSELLQLAVSMAKNIIHQEIAQSSDQLYLLLGPLLNQINKMDNFITIFVGKNRQEVVQQKMEELRKEQPVMKYAVLVDESLPLDGCVIETDYEVLDLGIQQQLEAMIRDF
ncbi:hypothetical protein I6N95_13580 [Vagococcus sp. BWB3-3]|uniref:Flagellar assembly protein FliH/Type III secretion system HrpE domain-containing protein n=1 Tax=Vagococcus allomyrinae TaxID=2794353 RepID=A0A940PCJ4_9ENTE|nr:FliH/SctL family protein [Vagococcus allomyrinae]MBP1042047.1 hypothetical protein [Vagococcus allomyrinae]